MPRRSLHRTDGLIFHVLNRSVRRVRIFCNDADYAAFDRVLTETLARIPTRLLSYCIMPNHWHLLVWPVSDELPRFMHRLTLTHAKRWHRAHGSERTGPVYQNRYTAVPVQTDTHLFTVLRYIERNPLRAGLVDAAERWPWSSAAQRPSTDIRLADWPVPRPANWIDIVNQPQTVGELEDVRTAIERGWPVGDSAWRERTAHRLAISLQLRGRPKRNRV
jgi:putative transposase